MVLYMQEMQNEVTNMLKEVVEICNRNEITYYCQAGTVLGVVRHGGPIPWDHDADIIIPNNEIDYFVKCAQSELSERYYIDYYKVNDKTLRQFPRIGLCGFTTDYLHLDVFRLIGLPDDYDEQRMMLEEARSLTIKNMIMRQSTWQQMIHGNIKYSFWKNNIGKYSRLSFIEQFDKLCSRYPYENARMVMNPSGKYGEKNIFKKEAYGSGVLKEYTDFQVRIPSDIENYLRQYYGDYMKYPDQKYIDAELNKKFIIK